MSYPAHYDGGMKKMQQEAADINTTRKFFGAEPKDEELILKEISIHNLQTTVQFILDLDTLTEVDKREIKTLVKPLEDL